MSLAKNKGSQIQIRNVRFLSSRDVPSLLKATRLSDSGSLLLKENSILYKGNIHQFLMHKILAINLIELNGMHFRKWIEVEYKTSDGDVKKVYFNKQKRLFGLFQKQIDLLKVLKEKYLRENRRTE